MTKWFKLNEVGVDSSEDLYKSFESIIQIIKKQNLHFTVTKSFSFNESLNILMCRVNFIYYRYFKEWVSFVSYYNWL